jgi:hypothetical protein
VRRERRCFFGWRPLRRIEPSGTSRGGWFRGRRSNPFSSRVSPLSPGHVNATGVPELEMPSTRKDRASTLASAHPEHCPVGQRRQPPHVFIGVARTSTRPVSTRFRARDRGRVRSSDFCRSMFPRARPRTARTSQPPSRGGDDCPGSVELPRPRANHRMGSKVRGRGPPDPRRSPRRLLAAKTSPQPRPVSGASCHDHPSLALSGVTWEETDIATTTRACKARER